MKHGHNQIGKRTSEYVAWGNMIQRCLNPNNPNFGGYGKRGIKICERWLNSFALFFADMGPRPDGLTLERRDNNKGYEPDNCCWATPGEQARNKRDYVHLSQHWFYGHGPNDEMIIENNQCRVAKIFGLDQRNISCCLYGKHRTHKKWVFQWIQK